MPKRAEAYFDIVAGRGGFNNSSNPYEIPPTDLIKARNIRYDGDMIVKAPGLEAVDLNAVGSNTVTTCIGGHSWNPAGTTKQITVWQNGNVYKELSGDLDSVTLSNTWVGTHGPAVFVEAGDIEVSANRELYIFGEGNKPQKLIADGASLVNCTSDSVDWSANNYPTWAVYHAARVICGGVPTAPHVIYISSLNDHGDFNLANGARAFEVAPGYGEKSVAAYSYLPERLYVWKYPKGVFHIDTTDITGYYLPTTLLRGDVGAVGPHAIQKVDTDVWFIASSGRLYSLTALRPDTELESADITAKYNLDTFIEENVDKSKLKWARLVYDERRRELTYYFTATDGQINDRGLVFDLNRETVRIAVEDRRTYDLTNTTYRSYFQAVWPVVDATTGAFEIYSAGNTGLVYKQNQVGRSVNGVSYIGEFQTPDTNLHQYNPAIAGMNKHFTSLEVSISGTGNYNLICDVYINGRSVKTLDINLGSSGDVFDAAVFGTAVFGNQSTLDGRKIPLDVQGETISLRFYNAGLDENFKVTNIRVYYRLLGDINEEAS